MALDIAELPAAAFSLAAIGGETIGLLSVDGQLLRVAERRITETDRWLEGRKLHDLNTRWSHVLNRNPSGDRRPIDFHGWDPGECVEPGDMLAWIEFFQTEQTAEPVTAENRPLWPASLTWKSLRSPLVRLWTGPRRHTGWWR